MPTKRCCSVCCSVLLFPLTDESPKRKPRLEIVFSVTEPSNGSCDDGITVIDKPFAL